MAGRAEVDRDAMEVLGSWREGKLRAWVGMKDGDV